MTIVHKKSNQVLAQRHTDQRGQFTIVLTPGKYGLWVGRLPVGDPMTFWIKRVGPQHHLFVLPTP